MSEPLVLAIQSHVTHGKCGNVSAALPIEVNGIEVDLLNTVNFSTHTAYKHVKGTIMNLEQFRDIMDGLRFNKVLETYTHLLTGYIGDPAVVKELVNLKKELNKDVHYFCDPVLGDACGYYVDKSCLAILRDKVVPVADTISPNSYEAEWLTDRKINNQKDLIEVVEALHKLGPKNVIISSMVWKNRYVFFSFENGKHQFVFTTPSFDRGFVGPGDIFAALLLAYLIKYKDDYKKIATQTVNATFAVIKKTYELGYRELALHKSVELIMNPPIVSEPLKMEDFLNIKQEDL